MGNDFGGLMIVAIACGAILCVLYPIKWIINFRKRKAGLPQQDMCRCPKCNSPCQTVYKKIGAELTQERGGFYCKSCNTIWNEKGEFVETVNKTK